MYLPEFESLPVIDQVTITPLSYRPNTDDLQLNLAHMPQIVQAAREAASLAESYRGLRVGIGGMAIRQGLDPAVAIFSSANWKIKPYNHVIEDYEPDDVEKLCGETNALIELHHQGFTRVNSLVVVSTSRSDRIRAITKEKIAPKLLLPCDDCGENFERSPLIDSQTAIMALSIASEESKMHAMSYKQYDAYRARKQTDNPINPTEYVYSPHDWDEKSYYYGIARKAAGLSLRKKDERARRRMFLSFIKS